MSANRVAQVPLNLPLLQNQIKRDPTSYREEFLQQYQHFRAVMEVFKLKPNQNFDYLVQLVSFISQVCACYPNLTKEFPEELMETLSKSGHLFPSELRIKLCRSLVLLRNKGQVDELAALRLFFQLFQCRDRALSKFIFSSTVGRVKSLFMKSKNKRLNSAVQQYILSKISDSDARTSRTALLICISLYRKNIWNEAKTVNTVAEACLSKNVKVLVTALKFFLNSGSEDEDAEEDDSDSEIDKHESKKTLKAVLMAYRVGKKSKKRKRQMERAKESIQSIHGSQSFKSATFLHCILCMIHKRFESTNDRFEVKLLLMALIARCIGLHKLLLLNFYPFLQKYLQPHQREVTKILLFAAQATHHLVPPEVIESMVRTIVNSFVTERNSTEVITVGLNSVREICYGCPLAMGEDLLQDLTQYKSYKNKNVVMAAKSLIHLFRTVNPTLLHRKDRGRPTQMMKELKPRTYGENDVNTGVPGSEQLSLNRATLSSPGKGVDGPRNSTFGSGSEFDSDSDEDGDNDSVIYTDDEPASDSQKDFSNRSVEATHIYTEEEFEQIEAIQLAKRIGPTKGQKRVAEVEEEKGQLTRLSDIEKLYKRPKQSREEKIATVKDGRDEREKFGRPKPKGPYVGKTNKKARRNKAFMMVKHKTGQKTKRSFRDKQIALKKHLINLKKSK